MWLPTELFSFSRTSQYFTAGSLEQLLSFANERSLDIRRSIRTAEAALAAGNLDSARRAVAYALTATGLRARLSRPVPSDPALLRAALDVLTLELERREIINALARAVWA